jgi:ABC-type multidrug transport system fused ATPase/permease subunit
MNIFTKTINTKLKLVTFVIFPLLIIVLVVVGIYLLTNQNKEVQLIDQAVSDLEQTSQQNISSLSVDELVVNNGNKSFDELNESSKSTKTNSSVAAKSSAIQSTPDQDIKDVQILLNKIETVDLSDDQPLDDQIIQN